MPNWWEYNQGQIIVRRPDNLETKSNLRFDSRQPMMISLPDFTSASASASAIIPWDHD